MAMTEFGLLMAALMDKRGVDIAGLTAALAEHGYEEASEDALAGSMRGEQEVDPRLPRFLARALALGFEEKKALALAFTFGQDRVVVLGGEEPRSGEGNEALT